MKPYLLRRQGPGRKWGSQLYQWDEIGRGKGTLKRGPFRVPWNFRKGPTRGIPFAPGMVPKFPLGPG